MKEEEKKQRLCRNEFNCCQTSFMTRHTVNMCTNCFVVLGMKKGLKVLLFVTNRSYFFDEWIDGATEIGKGFSTGLIRIWEIIQKNKQKDNVHL